MRGPPTKSGRGHASRAFRVKLDSPSEPELLFEVPHGVLLWTSPRGAIYELPEGQRQCIGCLESGLYAFDITGQGVEKRRFFGAPQPVFHQAEVVAGSDPERVVLFVLTGRGSHAILTYRWGDDEALYQELPPGAGPSRGVLTPNADEIIYVVNRDVELDIVRRELPPGSRSTSTRLWLPWRLRGERRLQSIYGMGVRPNGAVWLHLGDEMALIDRQGVARRASVAALIRDQPVEWAGADVYIEQPEGLWVGVEVGAGRDFVWVSFADLEARATPWPVRDPNVPLPRAEPRERPKKRCLPPDVTLLSYGGATTHDILPSGPTGVYWANGVPLASTLSVPWRELARPSSDRGPGNLLRMLPWSNFMPTVIVRAGPQPALRQPELHLRC